MVGRQRKETKEPNNPKVTFNKQTFISTLPKLWTKGVDEDGHTLRGSLHKKNNRTHKMDSFTQLKSTSNSKE